jgi:hypothetical protein
MATVNGTHRDLILPVFKFQRPEHSIAMCKSGNIHLSKISELRASKHGEPVDDSAEGIVTLFEPMDVTGLHQFLYRGQQLRLNDAFIFCAASNLVSQSLVWAINDGKTACVMLTDIEEVMRRVNAVVPELSFLGFQECIYRPKTLFTLPGDVARGSRQVESQIAWIKPVEYRAQLETRGVWLPRQYPTALTSINRVIPLQDLCIPVSYSGMYPFFEDHNRSLVIKVEVFGADGTICLSMQYPHEVMSPVIHKRGDRYFLGFTSSSGIHVGGQLTSDGASMDDRGALFLGSTPLEQVESIRYSVEE